MPRIVFPISSAPGAVPHEGSGRLINAYTVKTEQGARTPMLWKRSAGLRYLTDVIDHHHFRGGIEIGSTLIAVMDERVYTITNAGLVTSEGNLAGNEPVTIAQNNAAIPNIVCVADVGVFNLFTSGPPTGFADTDLPSVNSVSPANGYFVFTAGSGEIWASNLNSVAVATNSFEDTQMNNLRRGVFFRGQFFAMSETGIKVYDETGESPFPFRYNKSIGIIPAGICGTHAVAGFEEGWIGSLLWGAEDNTVRLLDGYAPKVVSNDDVSRAMASAFNRTLLEASVYMNGKNAFWVLTSPGEWTWEYNTSTGAWNERQSYETPDWRGRRCIRAFDRWIAGDYTTGRFASLDNTYRREYEDELIFHVESGDNTAFPHPAEIPLAHFDFAMGRGVAAGENVEVDPKVMISWSLNGGYNWGSEVRRSLGAQGEGSRHLSVRIGTTKSKGVRYRLRVSDPVEVSFMGGDMPAVTPLAVI